MRGGCWRARRRGEGKEGGGEVRQRRRGRREGRGGGGEERASG